MTPVDHLVPAEVDALVTRSARDQDALHVEVQDAGKPADVTGYR